MEFIIVKSKNTSLSVLTIAGKITINLLVVGRLLKMGHSIKIHEEFGKRRDITDTLTSKAITVYDNFKFCSELDHNYTVKGTDHSKIEEITSDLIKLKSPSDNLSKVNLEYKNKKTDIVPSFLRNTKEIGLDISDNAYNREEYNKSTDYRKIMKG